MQIFAMPGCLEHNRLYLVCLFCFFGRAYLIKLLALSFLLHCSEVEVNKITQYL